MEPLNRTVEVPMEWNGVLGIVLVIIIHDQPEAEYVTNLSSQGVYNEPQLGEVYIPSYCMTEESVPQPASHQGKAKKSGRKPILPESLEYRRAKNRISAAESRKRKKEYIATLERTNTCLSTERLELQLKISTLANYAWELKIKIEELERQTVALTMEREELLKRQ
ncbi:hypothetical protein Pelo_12341 [Pelomyxa schiedti]|nr:hypothetical protein Pelo_12341 [Pelomyxa schiedti]